MTRAVHERRPIHFLFRQVESGDAVGACGPEKDAVPGLATFQRGAPAILGCLDGTDLGVSRPPGMLLRIARSFFDQMREQAKTDAEVVQRAVANPYDNFALSLRGKLLDLMIDRMDQNQGIVSRYINEKEFQDVTFDQLARRIYNEIVRGDETTVR